MRGPRLCRIAVLIASLVIGCVALAVDPSPPPREPEVRALSDADWQSLLLLDAQITLQQERVLRFQAEADKLKLILERTLAELAAKYGTAGWQFDAQRRGWLKPAEAKKEGP